MTTDKIYTTLRQIREFSPCKDGWKKLNKTLGLDYGLDTPLTFKQIFDSNGYGDTLWCLRTVDEKWYPLLRHFACDCADDVRRLMTDKRSTNAIDVARLHADGLATDEELTSAWDTAWAADEAASRVAKIANVAWDASWDAARAAAWVAAWDAWAAASAAAKGASWADVRADMDSSRPSVSFGRDAQMQRLLEYCRTGQRILYKEIKV